MSLNFIVVFQFYMKKIIVFIVSILAVLCFSCNREVPGGSNDLEPASYALSLYVKEPKTSFKNGVFTVDLEIESEFEGEAFILMALRHPYHQENDPNFEYCVPVRGFGNEVKVDGFQIRSYHQMFVYFSRHFDPHDEYKHCYRNFEPVMDFPVFAKKIMAPKGIYRERINIRLPDGHNWCWGEIAVFRNNQKFEESMKIKADPEIYWEKVSDNLKNMHPSKPDLDRLGVGIYHQIFPDSSMFSYLITSLCSLYFYGLDFDDYEKEVKWKDGHVFKLPTRGYAYSIVFGSPYCLVCEAYEPNMIFDINL